MQKYYKFIQQLLVTVLILGAGAGIAFAGLGFDITTLASGFIRFTKNGHTPCSLASPPGDYCYGYGWSGNLQAWGYGYGYKSKDFSGEVDITQAALYGFDGDDGSATIDSVETTQTTATITFSTNYLATFAWTVASGYPFTMENMFVIHDNTTDYFSGTQQIPMTDLTCGTTYFFGINARDVARNRWSKEGAFTTDPCDPVPSHNSKESVGGTIKPAESASKSKPLALRIPAIFLSFGSNGTEVQDLQRLLNFFGTLLASHGAGAPGEETIYFRNRTLDALKRFQMAFHLTKVDGIYGPETQRVMYEQLTQ